jgi:hypothetical protein
MQVTLTHMYDTQDTYDPTLTYRYIPIERMNHTLTLYAPVLHTHTIRNELTT